MEQSKRGLQSVPQTGRGSRFDGERLPRTAGFVIRSQFFPLSFLRRVPLCDSTRLLFLQPYPAIINLFLSNHLLFSDRVYASLVFLLKRQQFLPTGAQRANDYFIPQTMLLLLFHTPNYKFIPHWGMKM